ncbi:MAG: hypothetical protein OXI79_04840 [Gammaproteobacteria bacterium]|nr:hypothetical protein [Gammaproteobacteria bacterium]
MVSGGTQWRVLDQAHRKRHIAECVGETDVDEHLAVTVLRVAEGRERA